MSKMSTNAKEHLKPRIDGAIKGFKSLDQKHKLIYIAIAVLAFFALMLMLKFMLGRQPKSFDKYLADAPAVLDLDTDTGIITKVYEPLKDQMGEAAYDKYVLGIPGNDPTPKSAEDKKADIKMEQLNNYQKSADLAKEFIKDVQTEQNAVKSLGGVATIEQAQAFYNNNPANPQLADRVRREMQEVKDVEQRFSGAAPALTAQQPVASASTTAGQSIQATSPQNVYGAALNDPQRAKEIAMQLYQ